MALCEPPQSALLAEGEAAGRELARGAAAERADHAALHVPSVPLALAVDYRSPHSHFLPPDIELGRRLAPAPAPAPLTPTASHSSASESPSPTKRKRGRPRVDRSSAEYLAAAAARKQAREMAAVLNSSGEASEKRKRGRPRVDKTSPEYLAAAAARKRAKELEALERKAKRQYKRRTTGAKVVPSKVAKVSKVIKSARLKAKPPAARAGGKMARKMAPAKDRKVVLRRKFVRRVRKKESGASSSAGDATPRVKRKYTRRAPGGGAAAAGGDGPKKRGRKKKAQLGPDGQPLPAGAEKPRGRRGRRRKSELAAAGAAAAGVARTDGAARKRGRPKLDCVRMGAQPVPINSEPIVLDSDDEPTIVDVAGESLSLDENLRALRHLHEKYAHLARDEPPPPPAAPPRPPAAPARPAAHAPPPPPPPAAPHVETLEDSSHSDTSSTSGSSGSSSSSSGSSSSSDSSDSEEGAGAGSNGHLLAHEALARSPSPAPPGPPQSAPDDLWFDGWAARTARDSESASEGEAAAAGAPSSPRDLISESDNESPDKSFQCLLCRKWYSTNVTLKIHKRSHVARSSTNSRWRRRTAGRYECDCCQLTFSCRENLFDHKAEAHRGAVTVRCDVCRRCFEDERELAAHDRMHTADERANRCGECGAQFGRWEQLRRHRACAHPPPQYAAAAAAAVSAHSRRHSHACHVCGKAFGHAHSLTRHLANHTKAVYRCVVCKASFARADTLAQHLNSHLATYRRLKQ